MFTFSSPDLFSFVPATNMLGAESSITTSTEEEEASIVIHQMTRPFMYILTS